MPSSISLREVSPWLQPYAQTVSICTLKPVACLQERTYAGLAQRGNQAWLTVKHRYARMNMYVQSACCFVARYTQTWLNCRVILLCNRAVERRVGAWKWAMYHSRWGYLRRPVEAWLQVPSQLACSSVHQQHVDLSHNSRDWSCPDMLGLHTSTSSVLTLQRLSTLCVCKSSKSFKS